MPDVDEPTPGRGPSRRALLGLAAAGAVGAGLGAGGMAVAARGDDGDVGGRTFAFHGEHQAGITTPVQQHLYLASLDVVDGLDRDGLRGLLEDWSAAAERMTRGLDVTPAGAVGGSPLVPPDDTGEALGLGPHGLTVTFGLGPGIFDDRFGLADRRPAALEPLPAFSFDLLEERISGGDLCVQACADDPQVAVHAIRNLSRIAFGRAQVRWTQLGYGRTSRTTAGQQTPRNLFGFKDGTANVLADDADALRDWVWADAGEPAWMSGGSYLVTRKILMLVESWDRVRLEEQEAIIGRDKGEGAPLGLEREGDAPDFGLASTATGPLIPATAHVRLAHPDANGGVRLLRRGYNFVEGNNDLGQITAGLFFIAYVRDPEQFVTVQRSLREDALNEYVRHVGSALFAVPPGARPGGFVGEALFS